MLRRRGLPPAVARDAGSHRSLAAALAAPSAVPSAAPPVGLSATFPAPRKDIDENRLSAAAEALAPREEVDENRILGADLGTPPVPRVIAEIKRASPSAGVLAVNLDPPAWAREYAAAGAAAISVVTDRDFFGGTPEWLPAVRRTVALPVLRKDFIIDPLQVREAARLGADAVLMIAAILNVGEISDLLALAAAEGLECLVEVHDEAELEKVLNTPALIIGINNRNLKDFSVDLDTTFRLRRLIPPGRLVVSESGIDQHDQLRRLGAAGIDAVLVGTSLVRQADRRKALDFLITGF
ncbi:MAG: indole-3-glycerol phosphate synthase TrpC [Deltaproteobacteria bacterium]|nr:indole-3-glycerol phosphate synthase TrpC [Candidatus Anaeroferrophillacea bacterium]